MQPLWLGWTVLSLYAGTSHTDWLSYEADIGGKDFLFLYEVVESLYWRSKRQRTSLKECSTRGWSEIRKYLV